MGEKGEFCHVSVELSAALRKDFRTACLRMRTTIQSEITACIVEQIEFLEHLDAVNRPVHRRQREEDRVQALVPADLHARLKELAESNGYTIKELLAESIRRRTAELDGQFRKARAAAGYPELEN